MCKILKELIKLSEVRGFDILSVNIEEWNDFGVATIELNGKPIRIEYTNNVWQ